MFILFTGYEENPFTEMQGSYPTEGEALEQVTAIENRGEFWAIVSLEDLKTIVSFTNTAL